MKVYVYLFIINLLSRHVELNTTSTAIYNENATAGSTLTSHTCNTTRCTGLKTLIIIKNGNLSRTKANNVVSTGRYRASQIAKTC